MKEVTFDELKQVFRSAGIEYYIKKHKGSVVKVHFMVKEETNEA